MWIETGAGVTTRERVHSVATIAPHKIIKAKVAINFHQFIRRCFGSYEKTGSTLSSPRILGPAGSMALDTGTIETAAAGAGILSASSRYALRVLGRVGSSAFPFGSGASSKSSCVQR